MDGFADLSREVPTPPDLRGLSHVPVLDGFRGIAILLVLAVHYFGLPGGWAGVDLFFVLSGFLITRILRNTRDSPGYLRTFYARRFLRIFPIYYLTLVAAWFLLPEAPGRLWWYALYLGSFVGLAPQYLVDGLLHAWSLSIEELFYLMWPFVVGALSRTRLVALCCVLLGFNMTCRIALSLESDLDLFYATSLFTRGDGLLWGALLALGVEGGLRPGGRTRTLALALLFACGAVALALVATRHLSFSRMSLWMSVLGVPSIVVGASALLWFGMGEPASSPTYRILTLKPLAYIGRVSYGLYLYHVPVLTIGTAWLAQSGIESGLWARVLLAAASFAIAAASWHLFEAPINGLKRYFQYGRADRPRNEA
jgi:peptidoglycan/LPS O-acetylase OafA/YrhL